jgi:hypothetical protein
MPTRPQSLVEVEERYAYILVDTLRLGCLLLNKCNVLLDIEAL